jgi:hypothetical protein
MPLTGLVCIYALLVYPYSQYVRSHGGREGSLTDRVETVTTVLSGVATDHDFRSKVDSGLEQKGAAVPYLGTGSIAAFERLAMIGEADRLVAATVEQGTYTGWTTIYWGFELMTPSWLYPEKPVLAANNYLAHIVGDVASNDCTTQVSYGAMANFFNAFSYPGALIGTAVLFGALYYILRWFFGNPQWSRTPAGTTFWFIVIVANFHHVLAENSVSGIIPTILTPMITLIAFSVACLVSPLLPVRTKKCGLSYRSSIARVRVLTGHRFELQSRKDPSYYA